jgi:DNA-binding CsgD family transcriptional regulator
VVKNLDINLKYCNNSCFHQILCEFCVGNHRYQISPHLQDYSERPHSSFPITSVHNFQEADFLEVSQFEIDGNLYTIREIKDTPSDSKINLAILLTARELQIAALVAAGCSNKQVAKQLHISEWTVATYLRRVFAKLGVDSRAAMVYQCASLIQQSQDPEII